MGHDDASVSRKLEGASVSPICESVLPGGGTGSHLVSLQSAQTFASRLPFFFPFHFVVFFASFLPSVVASLQTIMVKIVGVDVPIGVIVAVGVGILFFLRRHAGGAPAAVRPNGRAGGAAAPQKSTETLQQQLQGGKYAQWSVVVTTDAVCGTQPLSSATPAVVDALKKLAGSKKLTLVHRVGDNAAADEAAALGFAKEHLRPLGFERHQLICCSTEKGVEAVARQMRPTLFVGGVASLGDFLSAHLPYVVTVTGFGGPRPAKATAYGSVADLPLG